MVNSRTVSKFVFDKLGNKVGEWILINGVWYFFGLPGLVTFKVLKFLFD